MELESKISNKERESWNIEEIDQALAAVKEQGTLLLSKYKGSSCVSWADYSSILMKCTELLDLIKLMHLPLVKPRWAEFTDAGPGVGVNNLEVSFRDAELARIYSSDYRIRVHRANGDSGQNEAERTNSAIGDAVVDGATINWEYHKRFEGLTDEEILSLSLQEYDALEEERMQKNAWRVAHEVSARIDDAPVLSEYIKSLVSNKPDEGLFFNQDVLKEYNSKSIEQKKEVPGASYIKKIIDFRDKHYQQGELYLEFLKGDCSKASTDRQPCTECVESEWIGPPMGRIPRPVPDTAKLPNFKYKDVFDSYTDDGAGSRLPDDWQPRHNIKREFEKGTLKLGDKEAISSFSTRFIVEKKLLEDYLYHLTTLERTRNIREKDRKEKRQQRKEKSFDEYNWDILGRTGKLQQLKVQELEKYLKHFNLSFKGKKADKIRRILAHVCNDQGVTIDTYSSRRDPEDPTSDESNDGSEDEESNSEDDLVISHYSSSESSESESSSQEDFVPVMELARQTRSGRNTGTSFSKYRDQFLYF